MSNNQLYVVEVLLSSSSNTPTPQDTLISIPSESILSLDVTESVLTLLPKFTMVFADKGTIIDGNPISDKDVLHITFNNNIDDPKTEVYTKFIVSGINVSSDATENQGNYVTLTGYMAADNAFAPYSKETLRGTSDTVIRKKASELGLKFKNDVTGSESNAWYQIGNNYKFINHVSARAYIPNDGVFVYGTLDGTINYTSYNTKNALSVKFKAVYDRERVNNNILLPKDEIYMFYNGYDVKDLTEQYNNMSNYGGEVSIYNLDVHEFKDISSTVKNTQLLNQKSDYSGIPVFLDRIGLVGDKTLTDTIFIGKGQNAFTKFRLFSNTISLNINNSTKVSLFDKVDLNLQSTLTGEDVAEPYSGEYLVGAISHSLVKNASYSKRVLLCRSGINKSTIKKDYVGVL